METYTYNTLSGERAVRMIQLEELNSDNISTVRCSLIEVNLDEPGLTYQALSYVWGKETPGSHILVDGKSLAVTANLDDALRHLRTNRLYCCDRTCSCFSDDDHPVPLNYDFTSPTLLWVDAICINQKDLNERMEQVALMREIFGRASQVVTWLGRASEHTVPAFRLLFGLADLYDWDSDTAGEYLSHLVGHESFQGHWLALGNLLAMEWWRRVWIIQEITLARKAVLVCGPYAVDWERVLKATATFRSCAKYQDEILDATTCSGQPQYFFPFNRGAAYMKTLRLLRFEIWERPCLAAAQSPGEDTLSGLLTLAKNHESKDERDKIYAILGLFEAISGRQPLYADYTKSVSQVYMETARLIFKDTGCLEFLNYVEKNRDQSNVDNILPSWAPDWTVPSSQHSCLRGGSHQSQSAPEDAKGVRAGVEKLLFTCGSTIRCDFCFSTKTITVEGLVIGTIGEIHQRFIDVDPSIRFQNVKRFGKRITWENPSASEVFYRHLYWLEWLGFQSSFPQPHINVGIDEHTQPARPAAIDTMRCFQVNGAKSRCLACSDCLVQQGDIVCALFGGNMPYILRPKGVSWSFIGQWQVIIPILDSLLGLCTATNFSAD